MVKKIRVKKDRQLNTYYELWRVSHYTLEQAEKEEEGSFFQIMSSLVFTAFSLEAYLNHVGKSVYGCWDDLERLSPYQKLKVIAEKLGIIIDFGKRPFQTMKALIDFRNDVAHGKTVVLSYEEEKQISDDEINSYMHKMIESEWEEYATLANAKRARIDVEAIIRLLHEKANIPGDMLFFGGVASTFGQLIEG